MQCSYNANLLLFRYDDDYCNYVNVFRFSYPGIGHIFVYMITEGLILLVLSILIEVNNIGTLIV